MSNAPSLLTDTRLPPKAGLGLKTEHFREVLQTRPELGFFEVHAENYMVAGGPFHHFLGRIREQYPLSLHGVGLSIGGEGPLDTAHLQRLATLIERDNHIPALGVLLAEAHRAEQLLNAAGARP